MRTIVLTRIDDRLIHGQVVTAWVKKVNCNRILIVDDPLTKDVFMQKILKSAAPIGMHVDVKGVADATAFLTEPEEKDEKILILVKTPQPLEALADAGVVLPTIILGGMGAKAGRKKFNRNVSASEEEVACLKRLSEKVSTVQYQLVPDEKPMLLEKLL
ncbi:MAG: PTS sugar transporter subunit IIB [Lachnospiraceae bacterium]|nr:PTS sugar transporter subunit IIB [Lachnospiraceae bacterium]